MPKEYAKHFRGALGNLFAKQFLGVYKTHCLLQKLQNVKEWRGRIITAEECVANEMLVSTWRETEYRLDVCRATNGVHIDIYGVYKI
jgi:hypothetical protein